MTDLQSTYRVTRYFNVLQGLRWLPFGVFVLIDATGDAGWWTASSPWRVLVRVAALLMALVLYGAISDYYQQKYGTVQTATPAGTIFLAALLIFVVRLGSMVIDEVLALPLSVVGLFMAGVMVAYWWVTDAFRTHYLFLALALALISLAPLTGAFSLDDFATRRALVNAVLGVTLIIGGILDHLWLTRTLKPLAEDKHD